MNKSVPVFLACACLIPLLGERSAHADPENDPIVNVAPSGGTFFDRPLPSSVFFKLQLAPEGASPSMMVVRVWPQATFGNCKGVKLSDLPGTRQFHELAMLPNKDPDHPAFVARIPPLQVGQRFCVSIQSFVPLPPELITALANEVADGVIPSLDVPSVQYAPSVPPAPIGAPAATPATATGAPATTKLSPDQLRDAIKEQLDLHFKLRYQTELRVAKAAAGKAAELVPPQVIQDFRDASTKYQTDGRINPGNVAALEAQGKVLASTRTALRQSLFTALTSESVKSAFAYEELQSGSSLSGDGDTAAAANYAAIDTGVVAAFPLGYAGGNGTPWALPYVGLNLYFTPVDRTIPLSQLVGQAGQRLSLTIGRTLSSPTLPNRTISDFGFGYPVFAGGYRVSQFIRTTVGAVFYKINVENPISANTVFGVAPFIGMALDGDVIAIAQGKLFSPN